MGHLKESIQRVDSFVNGKCQKSEVAAITLVSSTDEILFISYLIHLCIFNHGHELTMEKKYSLKVLRLLPGSFTTDRMDFPLLSS